MLFNSFDFAVFMPLVFLVYWFILKGQLKLQNIFLLIVSYVFYGWWDWRFLSLIFLSSFIDYFLALMLGKTGNPSLRKLYLCLSLFFNLGCLAVFKYFNFFIDSFVTAMNSVGFQAYPYSLDLLLPVGISFYTFQTLSYTIDVYRKELAPVKDPVTFFTYVSFFPQLVAGPIERAINLIPQFKKPRTFSYDQASSGMRLILWGFFKKMVIADGAAWFVNIIFDDYNSMPAEILILGAILFAFQIYGDFSGYSDIAIGTARLLGFELMINFKTPYFSRDIAEFWRRWHISLSTWFRDYLYIPLGGNRGPLAKVLFNTIVIFLVSGFWHGANWTFIIWGVLHGLYFIPLLIRKSNRKNLDVVAQNSLLPSFKEGINMLVTFAMVCFAWIFFRAESVSHAFGYISGIFDFSKISNSLDFLFYKNLMKYSAPLFIFIIIEWIIRKDGFSFKVAAYPLPVRKLIYTLVFVLIVFWGVFNRSEFIYFQF